LRREVDMNFDQFAAGFRTPEGVAPCAEAPVEAPIGQVTIAGTVLSVADDFCCLEINGVRYEVPASDVVEIGGIPAVEDSSSGSAEDLKEESPKPEGGPRLVIIKVAANANFYTRVAVPALVIAAVGTWVTVVPPQAPPAGEETPKAA
jgi:hypothetical protein